MLNLFGLDTDMSLDIWGCNFLIRLSELSGIPKSILADHEIKKKISKTGRIGDIGLDIQ